MVARRVLEGLASVILVFTFVFFSIRLVPGNPAQLIAGPNASQATVHEIEVQLGLNRPLLVQYLIYLQHAFQGNFGDSTVTGVPVLTTIGSRVPYTLVLGGLGLLVSSIFGMGGGLLAAARKGTSVDGVTTTIAIFLTSIPAFWLGVMLIEVFAVRLRVLPATGAGSVDSLVLPVAVLAVAQFGVVLRVARASFVDVLSADFVRTAKSKGLGRAWTLTCHIARAGIVPCVTIIGLQVGLVLSQTVITESVFNWPGVGQLLIQSVQQRDYPMLQALTLAFGLFFVLVTLLVDMLNMRLDPGFGGRL